MYPGAPKNKSGTSLNTAGLVRKEKLGKNTVVRKTQELGCGLLHY